MQLLERKNIDLNNLLENERTEMASISFNIICIMKINYTPEIFK